MNRLRTRILPIGILLLSAPAWCVDAPIRSDTYVTTGTTNNFGSMITLTSGGSNATLMQFDLSNLPAGLTDVPKATLYVWVNRVSPAGSIQAAKLMSPWVETTVNGTNAPTEGTLSPQTIVVQSGAYAGIDVTSFVQDWIASPSSNYGVAIHGVGSTMVYFDSKENTTTSHPAWIDIAVGGPQGPQGVQGAQGADGPAGATGPTGPEGVKGTDGAPGATGATGPKGADGTPGAMGPTGAAGLTGAAGVTGAVGSTGPAGAPGATGAVGAAGAIGPTGPAGAPGATGAVGAAGAVGPTGPAGSPGATGAVGTTGPVGAPGATGAVGAAGAVGPTGPAGLRGATGATGPTGVGVQGPIGPTGAVGPTGSATAVAWKYLTATGPNNNGRIYTIQCDSPKKVVAGACGSSSTVAGEADYLRVAYSGPDFTVTGSGSNRTVTPKDDTWRCYIETRTNNVPILYGVACQ